MDDFCSSSSTDDQSSAAIRSKICYLNRLCEFLPTEVNKELLLIILEMCQDSAEEAWTLGRQSLAAELSPIGLQQ